MHRQSVRRYSGHHVHHKVAFDGLDPFVQCMFVVTVEYLDGSLRQYRTSVDTSIDEVHGAAGDLNTICQSIGDAARAGEGRQQRGVGVDDAATKPCEKGRSKDFHEAGGNHEIGGVRGDGFGQGDIPSVSAGVIGQRDYEGSDVGVGGNPGGRTVTVGSHGDDPGGECTETRVEKSAEQRSGTGGQDDEPCRRTGGHSERLLHPLSLVG